MSGVQYALTDDETSVAYRVFDADPSCRDPHDIVLVAGGFVPLEIAEEDPGIRRMYDGLRGLGRLVVFDRRGVGLSDPVVDWERPVLDQWADDLAAVVTSAGLRDVVVVSVEGFGVGSRFVAQQPEQVGHFVLYEPIIAPDDQWETIRAARLDQFLENMRGEGDMLEVMAPSRVSDPSFREWHERAGRLGASPASARRAWESVMQSHPREHMLDRITAPTLIIHRRDNRSAPPGNLEYAGELMPHAKLVEIEGQDAFAYVGDVDALVAEIAEFLVGERRVPAPERQLSAILFSDLVGSTERAASLGDERWKALLDRHDTAVRSVVTRCGGRVVKTTGDGVLALFPSASTALDSAKRLRTRLVDDDLRIRVGVHVGEVDRRGDDVSGLAVNIAARVMSAAPDDGIAVTESVVITMTGLDAAFEPIGSHELKGVPGTWSLSRLVLED